MLRIIFPLLGVVLCYSQLVLAQVTTGTISGTVKDATGAVVPGASVTARNLETGIARTLQADPAGRYVVTNLPPGNYEVEAELTGFQTEVRRGINLTVGREAVVDFTLQVGQVQEQVVVTGEAPLVDTTSSALSGLVDKGKVEDLPINGRDFAQLALLQPGVLFHRGGAGSRTGGGSGTQMSIGGGRPEQNSFLLDGMDMKGASEKTPSGVKGQMLGMDTVREFRVMSNAYSAEFGRSAAGVINIITRSGTNRLHASVFDYLRNSALDARNFFDPGKNPPPFKRNQFGATADGPILRDRAFFLGSYEGLRERLAETSIVNTPSSLARQGILPGRAPIQVAPEVKPYLEFYPLPNGQDLSDGRGELITPRSQPFGEDYYTGRVDHGFSDSDFFFGRYTFDDSSLNDPRPLPQFSVVTAIRRHYLTLQETHIFSSTFLNRFLFGFGRTLTGEDNAADPSMPTSLEFIPGRGPGTIGVSGLAEWGVSWTIPKVFLQNSFQFQDNISSVRGGHSIKAGFDIIRYQFNGRNTRSFAGRYYVDGLADFLVNNPRQVDAQMPGADPRKGYRQLLFGMYLQDDIKATAKLSLNLGLRYEFITVPTEVNGKIANLRNVMDPAATVGDPYFLNPSLRNFAPRVGFAWDPWGNGKSVVRAGFGIFHEQFLSWHYAFAGFGAPPFDNLAQFRRPFTRPPFPNLLPVLVPGSALAVQAMEFKPGQPNVLQYNFTVEKDIGGVLVTLGYAGSRGIHIGRAANLNVAVPQILPDGRKFFRPNLPQRNPNFSSTDYKLYDSYTSYNSLQIGVNRRFSRGFQYQFSYTFSKALDESHGIVGSGEASGSTNSSLDPYDRSRDRGLSAYHAKNRLSVNATYDLPLGGSLTGAIGKLLSGWQLNGIFTASSGKPLTIKNERFDRTGDHNLQTTAGPVERPDLRPGYSNNPILGKPERWLDPAAFELQPEGFYGNLGRNTAIGPGLANFDFSLTKNTKIARVSESFNVQFRAEVFNAFNRANFGTPNNSIFLNATTQNSSFGRIAGTVTTSRQIQFGLRVSF